MVDAALLSANGIGKRFGGVVALREAEFSCVPGEIHALLGGNGAGKSTMVKILCGVLPADDGSIRFKGAPVEFTAPSEAAAAGIISVFQELSLIPDLTVAENIFLNKEPTRLGLVDLRAMRRNTKRLFEQLGFPPIEPAAIAGDLGLADRQLVEIAKALSRGPTVLILDEATSALGQPEVETVFRALRMLRDRGLSIVFISHRMEEVRALCDRATIFRDGTSVATVELGQTTDSEIVKLMIGRELRDVFPFKTPIPENSPVVLDVQHLSNHESVSEVSFSLQKGEILGIAGLEGQGQGELLLTLFGVYAGTTGSVTINGKHVHLRSPEGAMRQGLALIPEDRKTQGLVLPMSVRDNLSLPTVGDRSVAGVIDLGAELKATGEMAAQLSIKTHSLDALVRHLSGGNQQKTVIGKWLLSDADIYFMYDPTRGIDVGTKQEIYALIRELADAGKGILLFSTELTEVIGLCHRALVMYEGRLVIELDESELTKEHLTSAALGIQSETILTA